MQIIRQSLQGFESRYNAAAGKEETADIIVPDSFPDILHIIDAKGLACLKEKRLTESGVELVGAMRVSVLYRPDDQTEQIKKLEVMIPFQHIFEQRGLPNDAKIFACASLNSSNARAVNPRKVQVTAGISMEIQVYALQQAEICSNISAEEKLGLEALTKQVRVQLPVSVRDRVFTVSDQIELPSGRPPIGEILHASVRLSAKETKIIGSKVVLKGSANVSVLYQNPPNEAINISSWAQDILFSQILEMDALDETARVTVNLTLTGIDLDLRGDGRTVSVELAIDAQALAVADRGLDILSDVYSTNFDIQPEAREISLLTMPDSFSGRAQARETVQLNPAAHSIVDTEITVMPPEGRAEDGNTVLNTEVIAKILYITEDGQYAGAEVRMPVSAAVPNPEGAHITARADTDGEIFSALTADGIEVRCTVIFDGTMSERQRLVTVDGVKGDMETPREGGGRASVILRRVDGDESLWDIAKRYNTTQKDIAAANALTETVELSAGMLLLIPRKR